MGASTRDVATVDWSDPVRAGPTRERLERAARSLPESDLKTAILATLAHREPTSYEAIAWITLLQRRRQDSGQRARVMSDGYGPIQR
jgi:hypothetical protein